MHELVHYMRQVCRCMQRREQAFLDTLRSCFDTLLARQDRKNSVTVCAENALSACLVFFPDICSGQIRRTTEGTAMSNHFTRRRFLVTAGAAASTVLGSSLFNLDTVLAAPYIRRNLGGMTASDPVLVSYRKAIKAMKLLPTANPLSWAYQAAIHGVPGPALHTAWKTCEHGTDYFWSWHRMYLYWFERIIRKMSGDSSWALPYWDYISPSQRSLPVPFRDPSSELYLADRGPGWNAGTTSYAESHVDPTFGNSFVDFFLGQSGLEVNPRANVHGDMGGTKANPNTATP